MRTTTRTSIRVGGLLLLTPALLALAGGPALAADGVTVTNTETVQAHLDANGTVRDARVYEQVDLQGTGPVQLSNPVSTKGLRNLDGFSPFKVVDNAMVINENVNGEKRIRAVSDFDKQLPVTLAISYRLDGKPVSARDVVGKSGALEVHYIVENVTGVDQQLSYNDGTGTMKTETQKVVVPMVGQLTTLLPDSFTDVTSSEASIAGDGHGATKMAFTVTLFGPIGSPKAEFGYKAKITNGEIPAANLSALPVNPLESPSFKGGAASYKTGGESGVTLTAGATTIDENLLKLRDGGQTLLAGIIQLRDGAKQLNDGLAGQAAPGAQALATGAVQLKNGLAQANAKAPALVDGLTQVQGGLTKVDAGLVQLYGGIGQLQAKAQPLHDGISQLVAGVDLLRSKIGAAVVSGGPLDQLSGGVGAVKGGLDRALAPGSDIDRLAGGVAGALATTACSNDKACTGNLVAVLAGITDPTTGLRVKTQGASGGLGLVADGLISLKSQLGEAVVGLVKVECGLSSASLPGVCDPELPGLLHGLDLLVNGVVTQVQGAVGTTAQANALNQTTLRGGVHALQGGTDLIASGSQTLIAGLGLLGNGAGQLSAGATTLSNGLVTAADGSSQLVTGLDQAATGAQQIPDGAQQLSTEGTSQLIVAGKKTASDYGVQYAAISAGATRASTQAMAYGAPADAAGFTAYSLDVAAADNTGGSSLGMGAAALVLLGGSAGLAFWRRRLV